MGAFLILVIPIQLLANFSFESTPLKEAIRQIEAETGYYFLYREAQVADIRITLQSSEEEIFNVILPEIRTSDIV